MIDNLLFRGKVVFIEALYYQTGSIRKHRSFVIIAVSMEGINLKIFP